METSHVSILLDIKSEVGALNARMMDAAHSRERLEKSLDELKDNVAEIKPVVAVVAQMKPEHDELMQFKGRIAAFITVGGLLVSTIFFFLWEGVKYAFDKWWMHH